MVVTPEQFERIINSQAECYSEVTTGVSGGVEFTSTNYFTNDVEFAEYTIWADGMVEYIVHAHPDTPAEALEA